MLPWSDGRGSFEVSVRVVLDDMANVWACLIIDIGTRICFKTRSEFSYNYMTPSFRVLHGRDPVSTTKGTEFSLYFR